MVACSQCPRIFHRECHPDADPDDPNWTCEACQDEQQVMDLQSEEDAAQIAMKEARILAVQKAHTEFRNRTAHFLEAESASIAPFANPEQLKKMMRLKNAAEGKSVEHIVAGGTPYVVGALRDYQIDGINWIIDQ